MVIPVKTIHSGLKTAFPAIAFFGGFLWDALTLGRSITSLDLSIILGYLLVAAALLVVMGRRGEAPPVEPIPEPESLSGKSLLWAKTQGPAFALQFCYGSMFSSLVIFYFLSSSYLPGFLVVLGLVGLLVLNEFLESQYHRFTLTWTLFGLNAILYFNFALPHLFRSIHPIWFFLSTVLGVLLVRFLKFLSPKAQGVLWPTYGLAILLVLLYLGNAIPPVPLVKKEMAICHALEKQAGAYVARIERPSPFLFWRRSESRFQQLPGEKVFCFTSVFLPPGISCTLYHRWLYDDPKSGAWKEVSRIGFPIRGGRRDGFRGYTFKSNMAPGKWMVRAETESGRVLGTTHFRVEAVTDSIKLYKNLILD